MRVYVLDDDPVIGKALLRQLKSFCGAAESFLTLDALLRASERPDLLIVDFNLKGTTAVQCAPQLEERWPGVPRVMTTASWLTPEDQAAATAAGYRELLLKPWTLDELRALVTRFAPAST